MPGLGLFNSRQCLLGREKPPKSKFPPLPKFRIKFMSNYPEFPSQNLDSKDFFTFSCCVKITRGVGVVKCIVSHQGEHSRVVQVAHTWEPQAVDEEVQRQLSYVTHRNARLQIHKSQCMTQWMVLTIRIL